MDFDGLLDVSRVRFASGVDGEDPEGVLLSVTQSCRHVVEVGALLWSLIGLDPLHSTWRLVLHQVTKDPSFSVVAGQLPLQTDRVLGFIISLRGNRRAGTHCREESEQAKL